jgi:hypothetical protein
MIMLLSGQAMVSMSEDDDIVVLAFSLPTLIACQR